MRPATSIAPCARSWPSPTAPTPGSPNRRPGPGQAGRPAGQGQAVCGLGINLFRQLVIFLKPVLPKLAAAAEAFLNVAPLTWADHRTLLANHQLNPFQPLMTRIEPAKVEAMIEASKEDLAAAASQPAGNGELDQGTHRRGDRLRRFRRGRPAHRPDREVRNSSKAPTSCCACRWTSATRSVTCSPGSRARIPTRAPWKAA